MKGFKAAIANTKVDLQDDQFTHEELEKLAASPLPIPVTVGFTSETDVATIWKLEVVGDELIAHGTLQKDPEELVPAVGYMYHKDGKWMRLCVVGLVPPDKVVTPGTWIKETE